LLDGRRRTDGRALRGPVQAGAMMIHGSKSWRGRVQGICLKREGDSENRLPRSHFVDSNAVRGNVAGAVARSAMPGVEKINQDSWVIIYASNS